MRAYCGYAEDMSYPSGNYYIVLRDATEGAVQAKSTEDLLFNYILKDNELVDRAFSDLCAKVGGTVVDFHGNAAIVASSLEPDDFIAQTIDIFDSAGFRPFIHEVNLLEEGKIKNQFYQSAEAYRETVLSQLFKTFHEATRIDALPGEPNNPVLELKNGKALLQRGPGNVHEIVEVEAKHLDKLARVVRKPNPDTGYLEKKSNLKH